MALPKQNSTHPNSDFQFPIRSSTLTSMKEKKTEPQKPSISVFARIYMYIWSLIRPNPNDHTTNERKRKKKSRKKKCAITMAVCCGAQPRQNLTQAHRGSIPCSRYTQYYGIYRIVRMPMDGQPFTTRNRATFEWHRPILYISTTPCSHTMLQIRTDDGIVHVLLLEIVDIGERRHQPNDSVGDVDIDKRKRSQCAMRPLNRAHWNTTIQFNNIVYQQIYSLHLLRYSYTSTFRESNKGDAER